MRQKMRKIGINLGSVGELTSDRYVETISELGFEATFSEIMSDGKEQERVAGLLSDKGIDYEFIHSDFSHINDMWLEGEGGDSMYNTLADEITRTSALGIKTIVVHLSSGNTPPSISDIGRKRYTALVEHAAKNNVNIAFENLRKLANVAWAMEEFSSAENVGFCWDCGHENCYTKNIEFMPIFGKRLFCTHIHDNRGIQDGDDHILPFDGTLNYRRFAEHIRNSGYTGTLMLEVFKTGTFYGNVTADAFLSKAADAAKRLRCMVDGN